MQTRFRACQVFVHCEFKFFVPNLPQDVSTVSQDLVSAEIARPEEEESLGYFDDFSWINGFLFANLHNGENDFENENDSAILENENDFENENDSSIFENKDEMEMEAKSSANRVAIMSYYVR